MDRHELIMHYCALFEKIYGEQPMGDLNTFSDEEIQEAVRQLNELTEQAR